MIGVKQVMARQRKSTERLRLLNNPQFGWKVISAKIENTKKNMEGAINPDHYTRTKIEPIDVIEAWELGFNDGNALKYIGRHKFSGTKKKDLIKAANYLYREATGKWLPKELQE